MRQKSTHYYHSAHKYPAYPNEADAAYVWKRILTIAAGLVSGAALTCSLVMLTMIM